MQITCFPCKLVSNAFGSGNGFDPDTRISLFSGLKSLTSRIAEKVFSVFCNKSAFDDLELCFPTRNTL